MRVFGVFACLFFSCLTAGAVQAQTFPTKAVTILHPYSVGSGPDVAVRVVARHLSTLWGKNVLVEARPGASGFIGLSAAKNAQADGHTLTLAGVAHASMNQGLYKSLPYDWEKDFSPISLIFKTPFFITVKGDGPYNTVGDLIAEAKKNVEKVSFATPYVGSPIHLGAGLFEAETGVRMLHVPFSDQTQVFVAIANGEVDWTLGTAASAGGLLQSGRVKFLAVANPTRSSAQPNVPTVAESGGPENYAVDSWVGLAAPANTPADVIQKINEDLAKVLTVAEVRERFEALGYEPSPSTAETFAELARRDRGKYAEIIKRANITPQ